MSDLPERPWTGTKWPLTDEEFVAAWKELQEAALQAMAKGEAEMVLRWEPKKVFALCDEILDRRPRNISYLMKDDFMDRANALLDRLEEEICTVIANGPMPVHERMSPDRKSYYPASSALRSSMANRKPRQ